MKAAVAAACLAVALTAAAGGSAARIDYVALGDSVASGYGLGATAGCARAPERSYPARVEGRLERRHTVRFVFLACSGATASTTPSGPRALGWQVGAALGALGQRPALVTITIGINDLEWWNLTRVAELLRGDRADFDAWVDSNLARIRDSLRVELRRLLARPAVRIVLTDYFDPVNRASPLYLVCPDAGLCRARVREAVVRLGGAIRAAAAGLGPRVRVASVRRSFVGHEGARPRCGLAPPGPAGTWIQVDCLHPNDRGAAAIARAVERAARRLGL